MVVNGFVRKFAFFGAAVLDSKAILKALETLSKKSGLKFESKNSQIDFAKTEFDFCKLDFWLFKAVMKFSKRCFENLSTFAVAKV